MVRVLRFPISKWTLVLVAGDALCYGLAIPLALILNPYIGTDWLPFLGRHWLSFLLVAFCYFLVFFISDLYDHQLDYRRWSYLARLSLAGLMGTVLVIVLFYFPRGNFMGRTQLILQAAIFMGLLTAWRAGFSALALPGRLVRRLLIVGAGQSGRRILEALRKRPLNGLEAVGFVDDDPRKASTIIDGLPVLGDSSRLSEYTEQLRVNLLVVAITHEKSPALLRELTKACWGNCQIIDMPSLYEFLAGKVPIEHISDIWLFLQGLTKNNLPYRHIKRLMDLGLSLVVMAAVLPLFPFIALAIKLNSRGPVFYTQERLGEGGVPFRIYKFRTMEDGADGNGPQFAVPGDPRITAVGRALRKFRLDELPQLINILKGDMSFVGPRPEQVQFTQDFQELCPLFRAGRRADDSPETLVPCGYTEKVPYYSYRLLVKPGITGWAQVRYWYASDLEQTKEKLKFDLYYIKNMGFLLDLIIILKTIRIVLGARGT